MTIALIVGILPGAAGALDEGLARVPESAFDAVAARALFVGERDLALVLGSADAAEAAEALGSLAAAPLARVLEASTAFEPADPAEHLLRPVADSAKPVPDTGSGPVPEWIA